MNKSLSLRDYAVEELISFGVFDSIWACCIAMSL